VTIHVIVICVRCVSMPRLVSDELAMLKHCWNEENQNINYCLTAVVNNTRPKEQPNEHTSLKSQK